MPAETNIPCTRRAREDLDLIVEDLREAGVPHSRTAVVGLLARLYRHTLVRHLTRPVGPGSAEEPGRIAAEEAKG